MIALYIGVFALFTAFLMCFRLVKIEGNSMLNTYKDGDYVFVNSIGYALSDKNLERGTVVVINPVGGLREPIIKRVIAVGGDEIDFNFDTGVVLLNGEVLQEDYIREPTHVNEGAYEYPLIVPDDCYFVMGDNRNYSGDSRNPYIKCIPKDKVLGKVIIRIPTGKEK